MSLENGFNRLKREIGVKRCIILDGNVSDVYLENTHSIKSMKEVLDTLLGNFSFHDTYYWDRVHGLEGNVALLKTTEDTEIEGEDYDLGDAEDAVEQAQAQASYKSPSEIFNIIFKNLIDEDNSVAFVMNWAEYLFNQGGQLDPDEREHLTLLGKAIKDAPSNPRETDQVSSTIIILTHNISMFPVSFYQNNPEVSIITMQKPDRKEREAMVKSLNHAFHVDLPDATSIVAADKFSEYIDMMDEFTNREIIQMAKLSQKEDNIAFDKLYYLFKYGEKDNPWEKLDHTSVQNIKETLRQRVVGQDEAIGQIEKMVVKAYMGLTGMHKTSSRQMPKGTLFFVGPTGVGKTELSKALAQFLFGDDQACIRFDMSEYSQENSDQKLIGAPPGYVGYEEGGQLTNAIREKPFSVILFDEIEKAAASNPKILDIFLQILEDGRLTDSRGETVHFGESVIIFTSNLGSSTIQKSSNHEKVAKEFFDVVKRYFDEEIGRPELLGRLGYKNIVPFNFILDKAFQTKIALSKLKPIQESLHDKYRIRLTFDDEREFVNHVIKDADISKGGRDILNALNDNLLNDLAMFLFDYKPDLDMYEDMELRVSVQEGALHFEFSE